MLKFTKNIDEHDKVNYIRNTAHGAITSLYELNYDKNKIIEYLEILKDSINICITLLKERK